MKFRSCFGLAAVQFPPHYYFSVAQEISLKWSPWSCN